MKKISLLLFASLIIQGALFAGGPWPKGKGKSYIKLSEWWTVFDQHFNDIGLLDPNVTTGIYNTSLYVEYGITDNLTGVLSGALFSRNFMNNVLSRTTGETIFPGESLNSIGDIDLGLKYTLNGDSKFPVALTVMLGLPTGTAGGGTQGNLQTGDGEFNQIVQLDFGTGFNLGSLNSYFSAYTGINNRTQGFSEEFRYGLELGIGTANSKFWLSGKLSAVESFKNGEIASSSTSTSIFANNTEFLTVGLEANYYVTNTVGLSAGFANPIGGEIFAAAPSYSVGIFLDFK